MNKKETKEFKTQRAQWEFGLRVIKLMDDFVSKEEPTIKLSNKDKISVLLDVANKKLNRLK